MDCDSLTPNSLQFLLRCNHLQTLVIINCAAPSDYSTEDDITIFNESIFALLTKLKKLRYVEFDIYQYEEWDLLELMGDIVVPTTWRGVNINRGHHEFFKP